MHVWASWDAKDYLTESIAKFGSIGLQVHLTEMDVALKDNSWASLQKQA